jgi:Diguanylate cyclase, GGDEF domain
VQRRFLLPGPDVGRLLLDRLVAEGVRYGRDFAVVRVLAPLGTLDELAPQLAGVLRDADVLVRWEADELLALLPATDRAGAERAAERLRAAADPLPVRVGAAHWVGDTARDLLARAIPRDA